MKFYFPESGLWRDFRPITPENLAKTCGSPRLCRYANVLSPRLPLTTCWFLRGWVSLPGGPHGHVSKRVFCRFDHHREIGSVYKTYHLFSSKAPPLLTFFQTHFSGYAPVSSQETAVRILPSQGTGGHCGQELFGCDHRHQHRSRSGVHGGHGVVDASGHQGRARSAQRDERSLCADQGSR